MTRGKTTTQSATNRERHRILKAMLEARRDEIHAKLRSRRETLPAEVAEVKDSEEQSVHDFVQDVELALMEMQSQTLAKIDEAMIRLEQGTYGTCAECGLDIAEARLQAVPFAVLCRDCQQREEDIREQANRSDRSFFTEVSPQVSR